MLLEIVEIVENRYHAPIPKFVSKLEILAK